MDPIQVSLTVDLDAYLRRHVAFDYENDREVSEPMTVEDVILDRAVGHFVATIDTDIKREITQRVKAIRDEVIREQVTPLVTEAVLRSVQPTDHLGNPKGEPTTMAEVIVAEAKTLLTKPIDRYSGGGTFLSKLIRDEIGSAFTKELKDAAAAAKAEVIAAVREKGSEALAQTIASMAGVR